MEDDERDALLAALRAGNVVVVVQPPRGFGENPIAIYHDPDLPPSHHYLAAYRWMTDEFGAHAMVHLGKHGNLEWLPGKTAGLSASCAPDAALASNATTCDKKLDHSNYWVPMLYHQNEDGRFEMVNWRGTVS